MLGVAQGVYDLVSHTDFKSLNVEFHIYGHGNEKDKIEKYIAKHQNGNVFYHGSLSKKELNKLLPGFQASIVPLKNRIHGAVPSKIFELSMAGVPVLFCGGGEGAKIVENFNMGYSSEPGDFKALEKNIQKISGLNQNDYLKLKKNCIEVATTKFDFFNQLTLFEKVLKKTIKKK